MLQRLKLTGYRGFREHSLDLRRRSAIVGYNNAGKSTIVEALRILSVLTERFSRLNFVPPPEWTGLPLYCSGVSPSVEGLGIQFETISNLYGDSPAQVRGTFTSGESIEVWLSSENKVFAVIRDPCGEIIRNKGQASKIEFPIVEVLPQISPLDQSERVLTESYVRRSRSSPLASKHFRNQLKYDPSGYRNFRQLAEDTWPGIRIVELVGARSGYGKDLRLMIRDRDFVAEVGLMGHGLQMWLQTMWFLCRCSGATTVVLDEPDVYMHPDLQRKLIRLVRNLFPQVIVATHSVEIIADLDPSEILIIDRTQTESRFADTLPAVQSLIDQIGGIHNVHLARLWGARRCVLVEGDDLSYLKVIHDKLHPDAQYALDDIPNSAIGGWDGWPYAIGQNMMAKNALGQVVRVFCILDSDYHTPDEIDFRRKQARERKVELHIWSRKEIENDFLIPNVIARVVCARDTRLDSGSVREEIEEKLFAIVGELKDDVFDAFATRFRDQNRGWTVARANKEARTHLGDALKQLDTALERVSGKEVLKQLSGWLDATYGRGVSLRDILKEIRPQEVPTELADVISAIERNVPFKK